MRRTIWLIVFGLLGLIKVSAECPYITIQDYLNEKKSTKDPRTLYSNVIQSCQSPELLCLALVDFGTLEDKNGNPRKAINYSQKALKIIHDSNLKSDQFSRALTNLSYYYEKVNLDSSLLYINRVIELEPDLENIVLFTRKAKIYRQKYDYEKGLTVLHRILEIPRNQKNKNKWDQALVEYSNLIGVYESRQDIDWLERLLLKNQLSESPIDRIPLGKIYINLANAYINLEDFKPSRKHAQKALENLEPTHQDYPLAKLNLAIGHTNLGSLEDAKHIFNQLNPNDVGHLRFFNNYAELLLRQGENNLALQNFKAAYTAGIQESQNNYDKFTIAADVAKAYYQEYLRSNKQSNLDSIAVWMNRAAISLDNIWRAPEERPSKYFWRNKGKSHNDLAFMAAYLNKDMGRLFDTYENSRAILLLDKMLNINRHNFKNLSVLSLKNIQENYLDTKTAVVAYSFTDFGVFSLVITKDFFDVEKISNNDAVSTNLSAMAKNIANKKQETIGQLKKFREGLVSDRVAPYEHIIIIPDGPLNYIPFEALIDENGDYLIENHTISYGFSASTYFVEKNNANGNQLLAFGPTNYIDSLALTPLNETNFELAALKPFKTQYFKGSNATKDNLLNAWQNKKIIHISSHGQANDVGYDHPWVAAYDDKIYLPEIYHQRLNADLVVLSACETSLGEEVKGEGVISLARGFFHAGANSVMASLWQVNEQSTAIISRSFYKHLQNGKTKAEALRYAKLDFIKDYPEYANQPHYWAGLIYIGEDGELPLPKNNKRLLWLLLLLPLSLLAYKIIKRRAT